MSGQSRGDARKELHTGSREAHATQKELNTATREAHAARGALPDAPGETPYAPRQSYAAAGVDVAAGQETAATVTDAMRATHGPEVLSGPGGFAGLFSLTGFRDPVLVSGTDGVGTKLELARAAGSYETIGVDLVAMCVNDVVCHGARPLFFLDYVAVDQLDPMQVSTIVGGVIAGCEAAGCALIGGETAEMPGVYRPGRVDLAGFAVGAVERSDVIDGSAVESGMALVGLASSGFHANGFSLLRALWPELDEPQLGESHTQRGQEQRSDAAVQSAGVHDPMAPGAAAYDGAAHDPARIAALRTELLTPTRIYAKVIAAIRSRVAVAGIAHVTGGGWYENIPRLLGRRGASLRLIVDARAVSAPPVFDLFARAPAASVSLVERYRTFNMGLGMVLAVPGVDVPTVCAIAVDHGVPAWEIGEVVPREDATAGTIADDAHPHRGDPVLQILGVEEAG